MDNFQSENKKLDTQDLLNEAVFLLGFEIESTESPDESSIETDSFTSQPST